MDIKRKKNKGIEKTAEQQGEQEKIPVEILEDEWILYHRRASGRNGT